MLCAVIDLTLGDSFIKIRSYPLHIIEDSPVV